MLNLIREPVKSSGEVSYASIDSALQNLLQTMMNEIGSIPHMSCEAIALAIRSEAKANSADFTKCLPVH